MINEQSQSWLKHSEDVEGVGMEGMDVIQVQQQA